MFRKYILVIYDRDGEVFNVYETSDPEKEKKNFLESSNNTFCSTFAPFSFSVIKETKEIKDIINFYQGHIRELIKYKE